MSPSDKMHGITEGAYTSRLHGDDDAEQIRAERAADARGLFAAITLERHGIDPRTASLDDLPAAVKAEMVEIAQALGLDRPRQRRPGYCACGAVLPLAAHTGCTGSDYKHGHCWKCSKEDR